MACLDVVTYDNAIGDVLFLFLAFLLSAKLKGVFGDAEIGDSRGDDIIVHSHLVVEKGFTDIAQIGGAACKDGHKTGVVDIYLFHLA